MHDGGAHVVVAVEPVVLGEMRDRLGVVGGDDRLEFVRLRDLLDGFKCAVAIDEGEALARPVGPTRFDKHYAGDAFEPKARRRAVLAYAEPAGASRKLQRPRLVMRMRGAAVVMMMTAAAQQPRADDVDDEPERGDGNRLRERHRRRRE